MSAENTDSPRRKQIDQLIEIADKAATIEIINAQGESIGVFDVSLLDFLLYAYKIYYPHPKPKYVRPTYPWRFKKAPKVTQTNSTGSYTYDPGIWEVWVEGDMIGRTKPVDNWRMSRSWVNPDIQDQSKASYSTRDYGYQYLGGTRDGAAQVLYDRWRKERGDLDTGPA